MAVRIAYVATLGSTGLTWDDEVDHDRIAWHLAQTGQFVSPAYRAAPLLPTFMASVYKVAGHSYFAVRVCQALLGALLVLAVYGLSLRLFDRVVALVAGWCLALYPQLIYMSGVFYAEHMFAVLLGASAFALVSCCDRSSIQRTLLVGLVTAATVLCRPIALVLVPVAAVYLCYSAPAGARIRFVLAFVAALSAVILPWTLRNAAVFGRFVPVATGQGLHLWLGNNDLSKGDSDDRHLGIQSDLWKNRVTQLEEPRRFKVESDAANLAAELDTMDEVDRDRRLMKEAMLWVRSHPVAFMRNSARRLLTFHEAFSKTLSSNDTVSVRNRVVASVSFYPVLVLGFVGAFIAWRRNRASWILHGIIISFTAVHLPMTACTRFRLPLDPYWIVFAAVALTAVSRHGVFCLRNLQTRRLRQKGITQ